MARGPCLRPGVDAVPAEHEGEPVFVLYDTIGFSEEQLVVSPAVVLLISLCDGHRNPETICREMKLRGGKGVTEEELQGILHRLDSALFLDSARFHAEYSRREEAFRRAPVREAACAGSVYPESPEALCQTLGAALQEAPQPRAPLPPAARPTGAIIPHIDHERGRPGYGQAYRELAAHPPPDTVVVLGVSHHPTPNRYVLSRKDFRTPLGEMHTDTERVDQLARALPGDAFAGEMAHLQESSIELQLPFLQFIWPEETPQVLPILCGSCHEEIQNGRDLMQIAEVAAMTRALRALCASPGSRILLLCSADLSHVGRHFGDDHDLDEEYLKRVAATDREYLSACTAGSGAASLAALQRHGNATEICSAAAIYTLLAALPAGAGYLLGYHQAINHNLQQMVSFSTMIFTPAPTDEGN